jgi:hypothetical protein
MAGLKGKSGPPGNMNAFKHGLAAIQKRREEGIPTEHEESVRQQILDGLIADKGGEEHVSTATRILAELPHFEGLNYGISTTWVFKSPLHLSREIRWAQPLR